MSQQVIQVGSWTVDAAALRGITLEDAHKQFPTKNKNRVKTAWAAANPVKEKHHEKQQPQAKK